MTLTPISLVHKANTPRDPVLYGEPNTTKFLTPVILGNSNTSVISRLRFSIDSWYHFVDHCIDVSGTPQVSHLGPLLFITFNIVLFCQYGFLVWQVCPKYLRIHCMQAVDSLSLINNTLRIRNSPRNPPRTTLISLPSITLLFSNSVHELLQVKVVSFTSGFKVFEKTL